MAQQQLEKMGFHPLISQWFATELGDPTAAQSQGWPLLFQNRHTLIAAPTGSGKTMAAFLVAIGPSFAEGTVIPEAHQLDVYPIAAEILNLAVPAGVVSDGGFLRGALVSTERE